jgi:hypothetical protein
MATTLDQLDACSLIDTMKVSCPSQEQSETDNSFILINEIGLHEFYKLIGDHPPESAEKEGGRDTGNNRQSQQPEEVENEKTEPPAKRRKKTVKRTFGTLEAFIYVLESSLKDLEKNGSSLIRSLMSNAGVTFYLNLQNSRFINAVTVPLPTVQTTPRSDRTSLSSDGIIPSHTKKTSYLGTQSKWRLNITQLKKPATSALNK